MYIYNVIAAGRAWREAFQVAAYKYELKGDAKSIFKLTSLIVTIADGILAAALLTERALPRQFFYAQIAARAIIIVSGAIIQKDRRPNWSIAAQVLALLYQSLLLTKPKQLPLDTVCIGLAGVELAIRSLPQGQIFKEARAL